MLVADFLACPADPVGVTWQLIDGESVAKTPNAPTHGALQAEIAGLLGNHLYTHGLPCRVVTLPGVSPRVRAEWNLRVPDLAVSCQRARLRDHLLAEPLLIVEILPPSNEAETWASVWAYTTIPSVQEILVVRSLEIGAELLRRLPDDGWPANFDRFAASDARVRLDSVDAEFALGAFYRTMELAPEPS